MIAKTVLTVGDHMSFHCRIFCEDRQTFLQDCEDDGETAAGGRLLHLMQVRAGCGVTMSHSAHYRPHEDIIIPPASL